LLIKSDTIPEILSKRRTEGIEREEARGYTVHTGSISPGVTLTCVNSNKFKTGCISLSLIGSLRNETAASYAVLPRVLRRGTAEHPDMERLSAALDELYGARVEPLVRKKGELHCIGLYADFPDDRFIPGGANILEDTISLLGDVLLSPDLHGGLLRADYVDGEKNNLIDDIRASVNDKRGYSISRLLEEMCSEEAFGVSRLGREEQACKITPESLTSHYNDLISSSRVEAFYCGSAEPARIEATLLAALDSLPGRSGPAIPETEIILYPADKTPRRFTESLDVVQGKLAIGFRLGKAMAGTPDYPALMVFNSVYGSGETSKLFLNVREKLSLCYYAGSMIDKHKGVMVVSSGVDFSKFDNALSEILNQLDHVKNGEISDWELTSAKRSVITAIKMAMDRPGGLEDLYFDSSVSTAHYDPNELCNKVEAVTLDRVVETASEIGTDSIYFLSGLDKEVDGNGY